MKFSTRKIFLARACSFRNRIPFILAVLALALSASGCGGNANTQASHSTGMLSDENKHRLYSAALASSDSPRESEIFKTVCRKIGIFDAGDAPNDSYVSFVSAHVDWAMKAENEQFKQEINSREKARGYLSKYLPQQ